MAVWTKSPVRSSGSLLPAAIRKRSGYFGSSPVAMSRGPSRELRYERVLGGGFALRCLPGRAEEREQEAVESDVPGGLPGEDEHDGQDEQDRVAAGAAGEHEVHVHEGAGHCG